MPAAAPIAAEVQSKPWAEVISTTVGASGVGAALAGAAGVPVARVRCEPVRCPRAAVPASLRFCACAGAASRGVGGARVVGERGGRRERSGGEALASARVALCLGEMSTPGFRRPRGVVVWAGASASAVSARSLGAHCVVIRAARRSVARVVASP